LADNFTTNPGTGGETFAADDIGGVLWPRLKISFGVDGDAADVHAGNPLPTAPNITRGSGVVDANTQRVTLATDGPGVVNLSAIATAAGAPADAAASSDAGSFSMIAFFKRGLAALTTLVGTVQTHDAVAGGTPAGQLILGVRQDLDTSPVSAAGDYTYLTVNEVGRLKTAGAPAQFAPVTGAITASSQTVAADVTQASNLMIFVTGTFTGHNCTFEGSIDGGTNWFGIQAVRSNSNTIELVTGVIATGHAYAWELSVNALTNFRVRATAHASGTANWRFTLGSFATEPIPATQVSATQPVSGTVTANIGTGALAAGAAAIGDVGVQYRATATGAASQSNFVAAATTNATVIKGSAGRLLGYVLTNNAAAVRYVKLHNSATAPTAGAGVVGTIGVPPNGGTVAFQMEGGIGFATGISITTVTGAAAADATAVAAADIVGTFYFA